jgi:tetratricopeptide (TPR) repeat protein
MIKTIEASSSIGTKKMRRGARFCAPPIVYALFVLAMLAVTFCPTVLAAKDVDWDKTLFRGYDQLGKGNTEEAIKFFQEKVRKYPTSAECHTGLGKSLKRLHKISEAKEEFRRATECDPNFADGFYELGAVLEDDKDWQNAATAFEKFLQLKPDSGNRKTVADRITYCRGQQQ